MQWQPIWRASTQKIVIHCLLVTTPMVVSSLVILYIVYANLVTPRCSSHELCASGVLNTTSKGVYYVDFSAARLAFVSSWSATVSFALVGFLMAFASYANAFALLRASERDNEDHLPSPHQMSVLLRVLNAELMILWDLGLTKLKRVFWNRAKESESVQQTSPILNTSIIVLLISILASLFVQGADVYFHIAAEAVELVQVHDISPITRQYSKGIAPWCLNRPELGPLGFKNFWGCAVTEQASPYGNTTVVAPTNITTIHDMKNKISPQHANLDYADSKNGQYAIISPASASDEEDFKATSFAVSTSCSVIPNRACAIEPPLTNVTDDSGGPLLLVPFTCTKNRTGVDVKGNFTSQNTRVHMLDFHKYAAEGSPFKGGFLDSWTGLSDAAVNDAILNESGDDMFRNPWTVLAFKTALNTKFDEEPLSYLNESSIWKHDLIGSFALMLCNVTVWDVTYVKAGGQVVSLTKSISNGSTAGMASMPGTRFIGILNNIFQDLTHGPDLHGTIPAFVRAFETGMSRAYSFPIASQMESRSSLLAQVRTSKVVTKLPVAALWSLVVANMTFALLGLALAIWALRCATPDVHQVHLRLGVAGLAAALFDREKFEQSAQADDGLFTEKSKEGEGDVKRIGFKKTHTGGSTFTIYDKGFRTAEAEAMRRRYFGILVA